MAEYEEDELADGSYDERQLYRAEMRAGKKAKSVKAKHFSNKRLVLEAKMPAPEC